MSDSKATDTATKPAEPSVELEWLKLERAKLEFESRKASERLTFVAQHPGVVVTGVLSLAAVLVSLLQMALSQTAQERQWRLQFSQYVSENYALIFSADATQRTRMRTAMEFAFPASLTDSLLSSVDDAVLLTAILSPMVVQFDRSKSAFDRYQGANRYLEVEVMRAANIGVRDLLVNNASLIPPDYQPDARALIQHYDVWLDEFERVRGDSIPDERQPFVFAGPQGFPFPSSAERRFRDLYLSLQIRLLGTDSTVAAGAAGL